MGYNEKSKVEVDNRENEENVAVRVVQAIGLWPKWEEKTELI